MRFVRTIALVLLTVTLGVAFFGANAQEATVRPLGSTGVRKDQNIPRKPLSESGVRHHQPRRATVIPPVTILHNPEYLSGEASINVAANSNPLIRIGIAQNGVTLIEFPS